MRRGLLLFFLIGTVTLVAGAARVDAGNTIASLSTAQGAAGSTITVTGSGWRAGDVVTIAWTNPDWVIRITASPDGTFSAPFTIPTTAQLGMQMLHISAGCPFCTYGVDVPQMFTVLSGSEQDSSAIVSPVAPNCTLPARQC